MYQMLVEIRNEPYFYQPAEDDFYANAMRGYISRTFTPALRSAEALKTDRGKENRYTKYFEKFSGCYAGMPRARAVIDEYKDDYGILSLTDNQEQDEEDENAQMP